MRAVAAVAELLAQLGDIASAQGTRELLVRRLLFVCTNDQSFPTDSSMWSNGGDN
jgi:hypothetical protein